MVFVFFVFFLYFINLVELELMLVFGVGAGLATTIGYIDDLKGIGSIKKLILQFLLVLLILYVFYTSGARPARFFRNCHP